MSLTDAFNDLVGVSENPLILLGDENMDQAGLQFIKVNKNELLSRLEDNREAHEELFKEAHKAWEEAVITRLQKHLELAKLGEFHQSVNLPEPQNHIEDYDRVIDMIKMSVDKVIVLTQQEFIMYVRDG